MKDEKSENLITKGVRFWSEQDVKLLKIVLPILILGSVIVFGLSVIGDTGKPMERALYFTLSSISMLVALFFILCILRMIYYVLSLLLIILGNTYTLNDQPKEAEAIESLLKGTEHKQE